MGTVWRAEDELLHRTVALKQVRLAALDPAAADTARQRVLREARAAAKLHHPNAVTVFDVIVDGVEPWLVMEYVPAQSLGDRVREHGPLGHAEVAGIGRSVAAALAAAHERGIVHRDVKPANILLGYSGAVKLTDFGIARAVDDLTLTVSGAVMGTPAYLSPEVASGLPATAASDVFALGATLYAAVEGVPPFGSSSDSNLLLVLRRAAEGRVTPPRLAGPLTAVLLRMLDVDPARRPLAAEVVPLLAPLPFAAPFLRPLPVRPVPVPGTPQRRTAPKWLAIGAAALVVAAFATSMIVVVGRGAPARVPPPVKCDTSRGELAVGLIAPLTGERDWIGVGMRNAAQLAVDQANAACTVPGYRLSLRSLDSTTTEAAAASAKTLVADPAVVGVVGPLYGDTDAAVQPVLGAAGVVQLAPSSANADLTRGTGSVAKRPYPGYFRILGKFDQEPEVAAEWIVRTAKRRAVAIVQERGGFGQHRGSQFAQRLATLDAKVVLREELADPGVGTDFAAMAARIAAARPDAVFFAGDDAEAGLLSTQLAAAGLDVPLVGPGTMLSGGTYTGRDGDVAVATGAALDLLPTAGPFIKAYAAAKFPDKAGPYGVLSFDATTVVLNALGRVTAAGPWDGGKRSALIDAVQNGTLAGASGTISFDAFGDNKQPQYTIHRAAGGAFKPTAVTSPTP